MGNRGGGPPPFPISTIPHSRLPIPKGGVGRRGLIAHSQGRGGGERSVKLPPSIRRSVPGVLLEGLHAAFFPTLPTGCPSRMNVSASMSFRRLARPSRLSRLPRLLYPLSLRCLPRLLRLPRLLHPSRALRRSWPRDVTARRRSRRRRRRRWRSSP